VLYDREEVGLGRRVHDGVLDQLEALGHVIQLETQAVEALRELVEVLVAVLVEHVHLHLQLLGNGVTERLQRENNATEW